MPGFGGDGNWPEVDDLKRRLNVNDTSIHDDEIAVLLAAGIRFAKDEVGDWDDATDTASDNLAEAALARAVELASDIPIARRDRKSLMLLKGERRRFGIG